MEEQPESATWRRPPKSKAALKAHPLYVLPSLMRQDEMVLPGAKMEGLLAGECAPGGSEQTNKSKHKHINTQASERASQPIGRFDQTLW